MNRAAVPIPEKLFFKIGEVCDITGVQAHVLRYWESEFPMLAPQKNRAGQRTYRKRDVEMVLRIKELLYEDQYTIAGAKKKLLAELRGASKLKVVTPEMGAQPFSTPPPDAAPHEFSQQSVPAQAATASPEPHRPYSSAPPPAIRADDSANAPAAADATLTDERRAALRNLRHDLRELLALLEAGSADPNTRRR